VSLHQLLSVTLYVPLCCAVCPSVVLYVPLSCAVCPTVCGVVCPTVLYCMFIGLTIGAKDFIDGRRSGDVILFCSYGFPYKPIGPAQFLWSSDGDNDRRQLWLIADPSLCSIIIEEITTCINQLVKPVKVNNLKNDLIHFRLVGPRSNAVLTSVLSPVWSEDKPLDGDLLQKKRLFEQFSQAEAAGVPHRIVIGLTVRDFRLSTPVRKSNSASPETVIEDSLMRDFDDVNMSSSLIWSKDGRQKAKDTMISDNELNKHRSTQLGESDEVRIHCSLIPVLLLHKTIDGKGVGWDIMVPVGWGKPLWISLVYNGARVIGLEEMKQCCLELMCPHFPIDYPDTQVGHQIELINEQLLLAKYTKYPPDKRPNFGKLNSPSPFMPFWSELVNQQPSLVVGVKRPLVEQPCSAKRAKFDSPSEVSTPELNEATKICPYYVLRSIKCLRTMDGLLSIVNDCSKPVEQDWEAVMDRFDLSAILQQHYHSLVTIFFTMQHRGNPTCRSMVCVPTKEDILSDNKAGPSEAQNKKGVCLIQSGKLAIGTTSLSKRDLKMIKKQATQDYAIQPVIPSRRIFGYATNSGYVYSKGVAGGVALCSLLGLVEVMKNCYETCQPATILVREFNSLQYRLATFSILHN